MKKYLILIVFLLTISHSYFMKEDSMDIKLSYLMERDIDLMLVSEFSKNQTFLSFVLKSVGICRETFNILIIEHSKMHPILGETDIHITLSDSIIKHALFIENKIDAPTMDRQYNRYIQRAEEGIITKEYDAYSVILFAPNDYLKSNAEASKYPNQISYERLIDFLKEDQSHSSNFQLTLLKQAIHKQKSGYTPKKDENVTLFWQKYYAYKNAHFPHLLLNEVEGPRGSRAIWPWYKTDNKHMAIAHKSDRGFVDLTLYGKGEDEDSFKEVISTMISHKMTLIKTNKSLSIRILVPKIDFQSEFDAQVENILESMSAVDELYRLSKELLAIGLI